MFKKILSLTLMGLLFNLISVSTAFAGSKEEKQARFTEKVKLNIAKLGTGPDARIEVKLHDKTKLKGYIKEAGAESFIVVESKSGAETTVTYPNVKQVKGNNLSTGAKIAIGAGIAAAIIVIIVVSKYINNEGG